MTNEQTLTDTHLFRDHECYRLSLGSLYGSCVGVQQTFFLVVFKREWINSSMSPPANESLLRGVLSYVVITAEDRYLLSG